MLLLVIIITDRSEVNMSYQRAETATVYRLCLYFACPSLNAIYIEHSFRGRRTYVTVVLYVVKVSMSQHQSCKHLSGAESLSRVTPLPIIQGCDVGHTYVSCRALSARNLPTPKGQPFQILISGDANTSIFCGTHFAGVRYLSKRCVFR